MSASIRNELSMVMQVTWLCPTLAAKRPQLRGKWNIHLLHIHNSAAGGRQPSFVRPGQADDPLIRVPQSNSHHRRDGGKKDSVYFCWFWRVALMFFCASSVQPCLGAESQEIKHRDVSSWTKMLKWMSGRVGSRWITKWVLTIKSEHKGQNGHVRQTVNIINRAVKYRWHMSVCMPFCPFHLFHR